VVNYSRLSVCFVQSQITDQELELDALANPTHPLMM